MSLRPFHQGGPAKADLHEADWSGEKILIKDFSRKRGWVRWLGRIQIGREVRAYRRLGPMPGIPRLIGRIDAHALAMQKIDGEMLAFSEDRFRDAENRMRSLRECLDRFHAAGVAHMDLRGRENVLLTPEGEIFVVDLAGAVCLRPGSLLHRMFFRWLIVPDETAYLKWKLNLLPDAITDEERAYMRRTARFRRFWIFNRKKKP